MKERSAWMGWRRRATATGGTVAPPRRLGTTPYRAGPPSMREEVEETDTGTGDGTIIGGLGFVLLCSLLRLYPVFRGHERLGLDPGLALLASVFAGYHLVQAIRGWLHRR